MTRAFIGLSGYSYREWQGEGKFYPPKLKQREYLAFYASRYNALEAVGTFAHLPSEKTVEKWIAETPKSFRVCPKMHQRVTHYQRLKPETIETVDALVKALNPIERMGKLGPILVQLPPNLKRNDDLLAAFLVNLPPFEWAIEFRHDSWNVGEVETLLKAHNVAWVAADTDDADAQRRDTADNLYVRLRKSAYDDAALAEWAEYVKGADKPVFIFCRHTDIEAPWRWADRLVELLTPT